MLSTRCPRAATKYSPKQNRNGESHRNESYQTCAEVFTLTHATAARLAELLGVGEKELRGWQPHYNIGPLQDHLVIRVKYCSVGQ